MPPGCAELLDFANVQALAGQNAKVEQDEHSAPTRILPIAQLQYGAEGCIWDGESTGAGTTPGSSLSVTVAPDAKVEFGTRFAELMTATTSSPHPAATENVAGDESGFWCATDLDALGEDGPSLICDAEMLVGDYWVSIEIGNVSGFTRAQLTAGLATAMSDIATRLVAAGPAPAQWVAPATTPPGFCTDSNNTASVRTILGDQTLAAYPAEGRSVYAATIGLLGRDAYCSWTSPTYGSLDVELLAGGSWVFPGFAPVAPGDSIVQSYAPVTVAGVSSALMGCAEGGCEAFLAVGTTMVQIDMDDLGRAKDLAVLAAFAKAIAAS